MPREQLNNYDGAYRIRVLIGAGLAYEREKFLGPWATLQSSRMQ